MFVSISLESMAAGVSPRGVYSPMSGGRPPPPPHPSPRGAKTPPAHDGPRWGSWRTFISICLSLVDMSWGEEIIKAPIII